MNLNLIFYIFYEQDTLEHITNISKLLRGLRRVSYRTESREANVTVLFDEWANNANFFAYIWRSTVLYVVEKHSNSKLQSHCY